MKSTGTLGSNPFFAAVSSDINAKIAVEPPAENPERRQDDAGDGQSADRCRPCGLAVGT